MPYQGIAQHERRGACPVYECGRRCMVPPGAEYGICDVHLPEVTEVRETDARLRAAGFLPPLGPYFQRGRHTDDPDAAPSFDYFANHPHCTNVARLAPTWEPSTSGPHPDWGLLHMGAPVRWVPDWMLRLCRKQDLENMHERWWERPMPEGISQTLAWPFMETVFTACTENIVLRSELLALAALTPDVEAWPRALRAHGVSIGQPPP